VVAGLRERTDAIVQPTTGGGVRMTIEERARVAWSAAGVVYPAQFHLAAASLMLGRHVRVGLEDNLRVALDRRAVSNAEPVENAPALAPLLDRERATPDEAPALLDLRAREFA
jgi:3-keto-5-aminohexanoate cleavage enzyme